MARLTSTLCVLASLAVLSLAIEHVAILQRDGVPPNSGWSVVRRADPEHKVTFHISLQQQNLDQLEKRFWEISNPEHPDYTKFMTREEVTALIAPSPQVQKSVLKWIYNTEKTLPTGHLFEVDNQKDAIRVISTARFAEELFKTQMYLFHHERTNIVTAKFMGILNIPADLYSVITLVTGITELAPIRNTDPKIRMKPAHNEERQTPDNGCNVAYTIKNLYNIPENLKVTNPLANASIYAEPSAGAPEGFGLGSIEDYQHANGVPKNPITCILGNGVSYYVQNDTDLEGNLDTELMTGIAVNAKTCFYIMEPGNGWMYEFSREVFNTPNAPLVISMSYGWTEDESCDNLTAGIPFVGNCTAYHIPNSKQYVNLTNINFQKLGVVGHTLLAAAGDDGTSGTHDSEDDCETMGPIFPAASPYVLTVGATSVEPSQSASRYAQPKGGAPPICTDSFYQCDCTTSQNEQTCVSNDTCGYDGGGGFSVYSPMPTYQTKAVQAYLASGVALPAANLFNKNNRGFPDVAAVGENICLLDPGMSCDNDGMIGGTSASTPIWGAMITLLNNDRLNANKNPLGFVNQVIYNMFYADSEKYFNNGFEWGTNPGSCPGQGFNAKKGFWTPLTGVGSPNFGLIRSYVSKLP